MSGDSVTQWIGRLKAGDETALGHLFDRYWPYLVALVQKRLKGFPPRAADAEDVAQEAFWGFYRSLKEGRLPLLTNRRDLLALWTVITARRAASHVQHERREKRGGGNVVGESVLDALLSADGTRGVERVEDAQPSPIEQAILADCYERSIASLPEALRDVAELYLAGFTQREIADRRGCSLRSVERKIPILLKRWQEMGEEDRESDGSTGTVAP